MNASMNMILKVSAIATAVLVAGMSIKTASAAENPMDSIGVAHNLYLECLSLSKDASISPLRRIVEECGFDPEMSTDEFVEKYQPMIEMDPHLTLEKRLAAHRDSYTEYQFSFFTRIDEVVRLAENEADADAYFEKLETEAISRLSIDNAADRSVLSALSTARHSLRYWSDQEEKSGNIVAARWRWWKVLIIVCADAGGVAIGGLGGGAAASSMANTIINAVT